MAAFQPTVAKAILAKPAVKILEVKKMDKFANELGWHIAPAARASRGKVIPSVWVRGTQISQDQDAFLRIQATLVDKIYENAKDLAFWSDDEDSDEEQEPEGVAASNAAALLPAAGKAPLEGAVEAAQKLLALKSSATEKQGSKREAPPLTANDKPPASIQRTGEAFGIREDPPDAEIAEAPSYILGTNATLYGPKGYEANWEELMKEQEVYVLAQPDVGDWREGIVKQLTKMTHEVDVSFKESTSFEQKSIKIVFDGDLIRWKYEGGDPPLPEAPLPPPSPASSSSSGYHGRWDLNHPWTSSSSSSEDEEEEVAAAAVDDAEPNDEEVVVLPDDLVQVVDEVMESDDESEDELPLRLPAHLRRPA